MIFCLNAPFGAPCFLTARRVAPLWPGKTSYRIASGRKSTPLTSKHEARLPDFSLRLLASPRTARWMSFAPEIAAIVCMSLLHNTSHLESNRKVVEWKERR